MVYAPEGGRRRHRAPHRQVVGAVRALVKIGGDHSEWSESVAGWHSEACTCCTVGECWFGPGRREPCLQRCKLAGDRQPRSTWEERSLLGTAGRSRTRESEELNCLKRAKRNPGDDSLGAGRLKERKMARSSARSHPIGDAHGMGKLLVSVPGQAWTSISR